MSSGFHLDEVFLGEGAVLGRTLVPQRLDVGIEQRIDPRIGHRPLEGEMHRLDDVRGQVLPPDQAVGALADHVDAAFLERRHVLVLGDALLGRHGEDAELAGVDHRRSCDVQSQLFGPCMIL